MISNKKRKLTIGTRVVYRKQKLSSAPGRRARAIRPQAKGEQYLYFVEKYWTVKETHEGGTITLTTRRGKERRIAADDPALRPANIWERWRYRNRFPQPSNHQV